MSRILGYWSLLRSLYYIKGDRPSEARMHLEKAKLFLIEEVEFLSAYDARVFIIEGRHEDAQDCLRKSLERASGATDDDKLYIETFCRFTLALYDKNVIAHDLKSQAMKLRAGSNLKRFLPFLSDDAIGRILLSGLR